MIAVVWVPKWLFIYKYIVYRYVYVNIYKSPSRKFQPNYKKKAAHKGCEATMKPACDLTRMEVTGALTNKSNSNRKQAQQEVLPAAEALITTDALVSAWLPATLL